VTCTGEERDYTPTNATRFHVSRPDQRLHFELDQPFDDDLDSGRPTFALGHSRW